VHASATRKSVQVPRHSRAPGVRNLAVITAAAAAAFALAPVTSIAQTPFPDSSIDLLQPSLAGNPNNPPRFRRPGDTRAPRDSALPPSDRFTAVTNVGSIPVYGSPSGFGAGNTGFDSTNAKKRKKPAATARTEVPADSDTTFYPVPEPQVPVSPRRPVGTPLPAAEIHPLKAAGRTGATLPQLSDPLPVSNPPPEVHPLSAANRKGAVVPIPPAIDFEASASTPPPGTPVLNSLPLGTPTPPLPIAGSDPYDALGIRAGSFLFLPAVEFSAARDSNPQRTPGGAPSTYFVVAPELHVRSDWSRHALTADIVGSYTDYTQNFTPSLSRPYLNSKIDGRIDVSRDTQILLENRVIVSTDNPGSPNVTAGLAKLPIDTTVGGTLGIAQEFNRLNVSLRGTFDRSMYSSAALTDGETEDNADRNFDQYAGILRVAYEIDPGLKPFVEVSEDTRAYDQQFDSSGIQRSSNGTSVKVGTAVDLFGTLTGEMAIGYLDRSYKDPTLPDISGLTVDGSLTWQATALTTAKLTAASAVAETILPGVSGAFSRDFNVQVDHAFRRWLIGTLQVGYGRDAYVGIARDDNRYFASIAMTYKLNRSVQLKAQVRQDWLTSSEAGVANTATTYLVGVRLQR
jgi:hypothetical protein